MISMDVSSFSPRAIQSKREIAHFGRYVTTRYPGIKKACHRRFAGSRASKRGSAHCQHRYPSPCRPVLPKDRPAHPFQPLISAGKRHFPNHGVELSRCTGDSPAVYNPNKGNSSCVRHPGSSLPLPFSASPAALRPTSSAALPALPPAPFWPTRSAPTRPQPPLLVRPPVFSATTQASAARHAKTSAQHARSQDNHRRRGSAPAAVLRLKD